MASILTVTQLNNYLSLRIKADPKMKGVAVKGEISNYSLNSRSGHAYFSLKDTESSISCAMFAPRPSKLRFTPEDGMKVMAVGNAGVYAKSGYCQIIVTEIVPSGVGEVHTGIEQTKKELEALGVFKQERKKQIPLVPRKIAVVTSPTGAALQDIIRVMSWRYPLCELMLFGAPVQGDDAHIHICEAIRKADKSGADTLIVARGGGSAEDLMPFNHKSVVLAVADCETPVITAVGHEVDTTLVDYAADLRVPTPSAAAEQAVPDMAEMKGTLKLVSDRLEKAFEKSLSDRLGKVGEYSSRLRLLSPVKKLEQAEEKLSGYEGSISKSMESILSKLDMRLDKAVSSLAALSPFGVLSRGYSMVTLDGRAVTEAAELSEGDKVEIRFSHSSAEAKITKINEDSGDINDI